MNNTPEQQPLSPGERLDIIYKRLREVSPSNRAMRQIAKVGDTVLRMTTTDSGDLFVHMQVPESDTDKKRSYLFQGGYQAGHWVPASRDATDENLAPLVELAETAEWTQELE